MALKLTLDYPPVWLLGALGLARAEVALIGPAFQIGALGLLGNALFWGGLAIMAVAARQDAGTLDHRAA